MTRTSTASLQVILTFGNASTAICGSTSLLGDGRPTPGPMNFWSSSKLLTCSSRRCSPTGSTMPSAPRPVTSWSWLPVRLRC